MPHTLGSGVPPPQLGVDSGDFLREPRIVLAFHYPPQLFKHPLCRVEFRRLRGLLHQPEGNALHLLRLMARCPIPDHGIEIGVPLPAGHDLPDVLALYCGRPAPPAPSRQDIHRSIELAPLPLQRHSLAHFYPAHAPHTLYHSQQADAHRIGPGHPLPGCHACRRGTVPLFHASWAARSALA